MFFRCLYIISEALILAAGQGTRLSELSKDSPKCLLKVGGVPILERTLKTLKKLGFSKVNIVVGYNGHKIVKEFGNDYDGLSISYIQNRDWEKGNLYSLLAAKEQQNKKFLLLMSDHLFDPRIVENLSKQPLGGDDLILAIDRSEPEPEDTKVLKKNGRIRDIGKVLKKFNCLDTGIFLCSPKIFDFAEKAEKDGSELSDCVKHASEEKKARIFDIGTIQSYIPKLRKEAQPFWVDIDTPQDLEQAKEIIIQNSSKEASDLLAHYFHKPLENKIVSHLCETKITPNQITIAVNIVAYTVTALFLMGHLLLASLITFVVGFIDGLDGKLARVRDESTKIGTMEHPFDLLYEFSWLAALGIFLYYSLGNALPIMLAMLAIIFIAFYRHVYDRFGRTMGKSLDVYSSFERKFRRIAGRRNLYNLHILFWILLGFPLYSLITILGHAVLTGGFYTIRAFIHMRESGKK